VKTLQVVKIGGAALADVTWLQRFATQARLTGSQGARVIVHGGGPEISALSTQLGIEVAWANGRRITTEPGLDAAAMVLSGRINKRIVRALNLTGVDAIGVSGEDARLITARVAQAGALGRVGEIDSVRVAVIERLLAAGLVPVISPICADVEGNALNVNADEVATAIAHALNAQALLFLTDVEAVRDAEGARANLAVPEARELVANGIATGGMAVKLDAALKALAAGVDVVRVGSLAMMNDADAGTRIRREEALICP
jgi:acetylglutamate kinase